MKNCTAVGLMGLVRENPGNLQGIRVFLELFLDILDVRGVKWVSMQGLLEKLSVLFSQ